MKLIVRTISLPLRHVFRTSHGAATVQETCLVELRDGDLAGYGEGSTTTYYGITAADMAADLEAARQEIESAPVGDPAELWDRVLPLLRTRSLRAGRPGRCRTRFARQATRHAQLPALGPRSGEDPMQRLHARHRRVGKYAGDPQRIRGLADLQDQAGHTERLDGRSRTSAAHVGHLPRQRQLCLDRRAERSPIRTS